MTQPIVRVALTGGAGQIAYQLLFRIASGELFGPQQPIALHILEIPQALPSLEGVKMELEDCAFPLLKKIKITADPLEAFEDVNYAILIGAKPRGPGMERKDLLQENGKIFIQQGRALNEVANPNIKVFVVGNPCNTNCYIAKSHAPRLEGNQFFAMTRLDQNRASFLLAQKSDNPVETISNMTIWGNHSSTLVPDFTHARIRGKRVEEVIKDRHWLENQFIELVQKRGAVIIQARGKSSAASAAQAILDSIQDILFSTPEGEWFSLAMSSKGNPYGIDDDLIFSFPCYSRNGEIRIVSGLEISDFLKGKLKVTEQELIEERDFLRTQ